VTEKEWHDDTIAVRGGLRRTELDETAEALFLTSGYVYSSAAEAEAAFAGEVDRYIYSRYGNPIVATFEARFRQLEDTEAAWATASGMAAVFNALAACLETGDRVVAARGLFGSCFIILDELLPRWGISTEFVDGPDLDQWAAALAKGASAGFFESPSNPMQELIDVKAVSELAHQVGATVIVDNVFATPILQRPLELGADIVVCSATKHIDGHGRTLGGMICGTEQFIYEQAPATDATHRPLTEPIQRLGAPQEPRVTPASGHASNRVSPPPGSDGSKRRIASRRCDTRTWRRILSPLWRSAR